MQLVMQTQQIAMMTMGKIKNPVSDAFDKNLEYSKLSIDAIVALSQDTKSNFSLYEEKYLTETVTQLKIFYTKE